MWNIRSHFKMYQFDSIIRFFAIITFIFCVGCKKREPNPELRDPIYLDLKTIVGELTGVVSSGEASVETEFENLKNAQPRTKDAALAKKRYREAVKKLSKAKQKFKFYEIKLERRLLEARLSYEKSFQEEKDWPDPKEFSAYQANKELRAANMNWGSRVPRLHERIKNYNQQVSAGPNSK